MTEFSRTIEIAATPKRVWSVMSDVERWHEWTPSITSITRLDRVPLGVGSRVVIRQPKLPVNYSTVTELEADRGFTWVSRSRGVVATARHLIVPSGAGSRVTLSVHFGGMLGWFVAWMAGGLTERYIAMEAEGLKRRSERLTPDS
jgi:carbon monoxide dehydrogenase subunit G